MKFKEILNRMRGFSIGPIGADWEPPELESKIVQRVITFLEDRRALYNDYELEVADYVVQSVIEIRHFLTDELSRLPNEPGLAASLRYMRGACREFLDQVQQAGRHRTDMFHGGPPTWHFCTALGRLRAVFGVHIGLLAGRYKLGLEGDLAKILPPPEDGD